MTNKSETLDLKGRKGPSKATSWLYIPLVIFGGIRVVMHVVERFDTSLYDGVMALVTIAAIFLGAVALFLALGAFLEWLMIARARRAADSRELFPMNLSVNSYQQAFNISGRAVFLPQKHQGVFVALRSNAIELYTGFGHYDDPLFRIRFSDINTLRREVLQLYGGKEPGLVIERVKGPFELGFVRTAVFRPISISKKQAEARFEMLESALTDWQRRERGDAQTG